MSYDLFKGVGVRDSHFGPKEVVLHISDEYGAYFPETASDLTQVYTEYIAITLSNMEFASTTVVGGYEGDFGEIRVTRITQLEGLVPYRALCWVFATAEPVSIDS